MADSNYGKRPWSQPHELIINGETHIVDQPIDGPSRPNNYQTFIEDLALAPTQNLGNDMSDEQIRSIRPSALPQVDLLPPKFGYDETPLQITDVVSLDNRFERISFSGRVSGYEGTSYPSLNQF